MTQPGFDFAAAPKPDLEPRKHGRDTSRARIDYMRDHGLVTARQHLFLDALTTYTHQHGAPTLGELTDWAWRRGFIPRNEGGFFGPRCTELGPGTRRRQPDGSYTTTGGGVIEYLPARVCRITGATAHPIRVMR